MVEIGENLARTLQAVGFLVFVGAGLWMMLR